jgi:predicted Zn-dependent protease
MADILKLAQKANEDGNSASAFELYKLAAAVNPSVNSRKQSAIYGSAVINLLEIGRVSDAELFLNKIKWNSTPKPWLIEYALGKIRLAQFKPGDAEAHFRNALRLNPASTSPAIFLADCLIQQEKFDEARSILNEALKVEGDLDEVYLNLSFVERATGNYEAARRYAIKALAITPDYQDAKRVLTDIELWLSLKREFDGP